MFKLQQLFEIKKKFDLRGETQFKTGTFKVGLLFFVSFFELGCEVFHYNIYSTLPKFIGKNSNFIMILIMEIIMMYKIVIYISYYNGDKIGRNSF